MPNYAQLIALSVPSGKKKPVFQVKKPVFQVKFLLQTHIGTLNYAQLIVLIDLIKLTTTRKRVVAFF